MRQWIQNP